MSTIIYHHHHIIPKYRCKEIGIDPDFPENIIRLTRTEHAQAHYERWLKHGRKEDLGAAQFLARGEIDGIDFSGKNNPFYGKKHTEETRKKIRVANTGRKHTEKYKKELSESQSGEGNPMYGRTGKNNPRYGKKLSTEHIKKMSESQSGDKNHMYGKKHSPETLKKMSISLKKHWEKKRNANE